MTHVEVEIGVVLIAVRRNHVDSFIELNLLRSRSDNRDSTRHPVSPFPLFGGERNALRFADGNDLLDGFFPPWKRVEVLAQRKIIALPKMYVVPLHLGANGRHTFFLVELAVGPENRGKRGVLDLDGRFVLQNALLVV